MKLLRTLAATMVLLGAVAGATTLVPLDVAGLTRLSDVIVRGTVTRVEPRWTKDGARIITDADLEVAETFKGRADRALTVMQPGGEVGDVGQRVHGAARFSVGEEVVVFLEARGDRFIVTGMVQGKFHLEHSTDGRVTLATTDGEATVIDPVTRELVERPAISLTLDQLRGQIRAALREAQPPAPGPLAPGTRPVAPTAVTP